MLFMAYTAACIARRSSWTNGRRHRNFLGAVKRSVDEDPSPGRYILTGSVRAELENQVWPGTGRLLQVPMYGMLVREVRGRARVTLFLDRS
jgi:uncharacterized protein